ncbi:MAG: nucleotidyl transferase AbiEii/AbiGii toxin family protein [Candidatus Kerfeldbacteria bacterium]|nr:nucleotidyl transferase AbiEii/AbiGii toxin family protein [Candidatus Kerfeldbacteria bacterium]
MLTLEQIEQQYPDNLRAFKRPLLREYLQYKILEVIFASEYATKLSFLGGTALRIVYGNNRFSEDIDFDNFGLEDHEFDAVAQKVKAGLEAEGFKVEIDIVGKEAYRCNVRFPNLLFDSGLSSHQEEKIRIQIDSLAHGFAYQPERKILNKFDVFTEIFVTPQDVLLSQKISAAVSRKRAKGRDFYDIVFLLSFTKPNYPYLQQKIGVGEPEALRARMITLADTLDLIDLARDVEPFLFHPSDSKKIELFRDFMKQATL